ncbi:MAG: phospholipase D/Transphosphatidylase, partial [Rhodospirillales bacterium]|nr:phospholipase D/Transphosphatidylase [Rhodospirillales bacterium]
MDGTVQKLPADDAIDRKRDTMSAPGTTTSPGNFFKPGANCWRHEQASRFAILVDGEAFFSAARAAMRRAERRIVILAWDFDSATYLRPHRRGARRLPVGEFLHNLVEERPDLEIFILVWWGSVFYGANRDFPISFGTEWWSHPRIHFRLDDHHPIGACHHQKIIVIDDKIAFSGGMDLTQGRWDSARHTPDNCHRQEPDAPYGPVHDIQSLFDGDAARAMTELVRERWRLVTGETLEPVVTRSNPWPRRVLPRLRNIRVAIARSQPPFNEQPEVREVEALNMDMLRAAKRLIYIEQQYYTINAINELLCEHLQREDGPEIVIVMNDISSGWIEQKAMFGNRDSLFTLLRRADRFGRLRTVTPVCQINPLVKIKVHSKVTIVDDRYLRIGSSNFNHRSLGFDTECDIAIGDDSSDTQQAIRTFSHRLLGEHMGVRPRRVARAIRRHGSVVRAIDALNVGKRRMVAFPDAEFDGEVAFTPGSALIDPPRSIDLKYLWDWLLS